MPVERLNAALAALRSWEDTPAFSFTEQRQDDDDDAKGRTSSTPSPAPQSEAAHDAAVADVAPEASRVVSMAPFSNPSLLPRPGKRSQGDEGINIHADVIRDVPQPHTQGHSHYRRLRESTGGSVMMRQASSGGADDSAMADEETVCYIDVATQRFAGAPAHLLGTFPFIEDPRCSSGRAEAAYLAELTLETVDMSKRTKSEAEPVPELNKKERAMAAMRSVVSQNKIRFQDDGFDLDLTYITPRVIAMGFPSTGRESYYRNPMPEVERFFAKRHPKHFRIYNLCREREYDLPSRFGGAHRRFPFDDHNAPSDIALIPAFIRDAVTFLKEDDDNVVAIHCKAGKGRTGLMVSCLLMALDTNLRDPEAALQFFGDARTNDSQGVTIPSQKRYVRYWGTLMDRYQGVAPTDRRKLYLNRVSVNTLVKAKAGVPFDMYFTIHCNLEEVFDGRKSAVSSSGSKLFNAARGAYIFDLVGSSSSAEQTDDEHAAANAENTSLSPRILELELFGDVRFTFFMRNKLMADEELFHCWLNTTLCEFPKQHISKIELDGPSKDRKHREFCAELAVALVFEAPEWVEKQKLGGQAAAVPAAAAGGKKEKKGFFSRVFGK